MDWWDILYNINTNGIETDSETYCCSNSTCHYFLDLRHQIDVEGKLAQSTNPVYCPYGKILPNNKKCGNECPILSSEYLNISFSRIKLV